jgi:hypothetical protein
VTSQFVLRGTAMPKHHRITAALLLAVCSAPVIAQDPAQTDPDKIVLEAKVGSVMTSTGGDFQSVDTGKLLVEGESMMLNDGAKATVVYYYYYDEGKRYRKCVEEYRGPDTFVIDDSCKAAAWLTSHRGTVFLVGGAVLGAALLASRGDTAGAPGAPGAPGGPGGGPISAGPN